MIDLGSKSGVSKLHERISHSREKVQPFRDIMRRALRTYVGSVYPQDSRIPDGEETFVNLFQQAVEVFVLLLAGGQLKGRLSTHDQTLKDTASRLQTALNNTMRGIHLEQTNRMIVLDSLFRMGIAKVYQAEGRQAEVENDTWIEVGRPYVKRVSLDDFVYDTTQRRLSEIRFACDEYELPWNALKGDDFYDQKVVKKIIPGVSSNKSSAGERKFREMSVGLVDDPGYKDEYVTLMDVWVPETEEVAILARYDSTLAPLAVIPWEGSRTGPYELLFMGDVPDNIMPISLADQLKPLHDLFNEVFVKLIHQAQSMKTVPWYEASSAQDMDRLRVAGDWQDAIKVSNREGLGAFKWGEVDGNLMAFGIQALGMFDRQGGNLQATLGLGPQSGTLGQDEMILGQVSRKLGKYAEKVVDFCQREGEQLLRLIWEDEVNEIPGEYKLPGVGSIPYSWSSEHRAGNLEDFQVEIDPYALAYESPATKLAKLERQVGSILQMWPIFEAAGAVLDPRDLLEAFAELGNSDWLRHIIRFVRKPGEGGGNGEGGTKSPHTVRENVRRNVSTGPTNKESDRLLAEMMTTNRPQSTERQRSMVSLG